MKLIIATLILLASFGALAKKQYISGNQKITFRSGPGKDFKIEQMIASDSAVTVVEEQGDWVKVKDENEKEGYVMKRFLSEEVPYSLKYNWLRGQFNKQKEEMDELKEDNARLKNVLKETQGSLTKAKESFTTVTSNYEELKSGSANYLKLKASHDKAQQTVTVQQEKIRKLESLQLKEYMMCFLAGVGVLVIGWTIGATGKKRNSYGSSIQL